MNATVSQEPSGKYFVSLCCVDISEKEYKPTGNPIGIDLGLKEFAATSDGEMIPNPKYLAKQQKKLAKLQRKISRKSKGSSNCNKARIKVAICHEKIANQRKDFLQKLSTQIINENDIICMEDLSVKNMIMFNATRPCEYYGSHIRFSGMNPEIHLRPHQENAVAHILYGHNTLLAHCVGIRKKCRPERVQSGRRRLSSKLQAISSMPDIWHKGKQENP